MEVMNQRSNTSNMTREDYEKFLADQCVNSIKPISPTPIRETVKYLYATCICNMELAMGLGNELYGKQSDTDSGKVPVGDNLRDTLVCILEVCKKTQSDLQDLKLNIAGERSKGEA